MTRDLFENGPKYSMHPIEGKQNLSLYGIHANAYDIIKSRSITVVEGFSDVIALSKIGIHNAVGIISNVPSAAQISMIRCLASTILVFGDGDEAGRKLIETMRERAVGRTVIGLQITGLDPCEAVMKIGPTVKRLLAAAYAAVDDYTYMEFDQDGEVLELVERDGNNARTGD